MKTSNFSGFSLRKSVFTLIELLLVISILTILMGMMLPTLSRAKAKGKQASCINKLKQIAIAFQYYATDNDGFMVHDREVPAPPATQYWHQQLRQELGDPSSTATESSTFFKDPGMSGAFDFGIDKAEASHYLYNDQVAGEGKDSGIRLVNAEETAKTLLVFDGSFHQRIGNVLALDTLVVGDTVTALMLTFPHPADKSNIVFLDGHANVTLNSQVPTDGDDVFWNPSPSATAP